MHIFGSKRFAEAVDPIDEQEARRQINEAALAVPRFKNT